MELELEIIAAVEAAKACTEEASLGDFQFQATPDGSYLINLKTGHVQRIREDKSELFELDEFFGSDSVSGGMSLVSPPVYGLAKAG